MADGSGCCPAVGIVHVGTRITWQGERGPKTAVNCAVPFEDVARDIVQRRLRWDTNDQ
jgi:hypothetical protein